MEIKWLGTAGFEIQTEGRSFLIDPFLSRNRAATPTQNLTPDHFRDTGQIFISHGHFDHIQDVPRIAEGSNCDIFCSESVGRTLQEHHTDTERIKSIQTDQKLLDFNFYNAQAFFSEHVRFDKKLVLSTLFRLNFRVFKYVPLLKNFPCGQVLSWRFFVENKIIQFFGSAGSTDTELETIKKHPPIDILLVPLQGHSDICEIAVNYVRHLKPETVIVHHQDNFFPPISQTVDVQPFLDTVKTSCPHTRVIVPKINTPLVF